MLFLSPSPPRRATPSISHCLLLHVEKKRGSSYLVGSKIDRITVLRGFKITVTILDR